jgi:hypothetical protein
LAAGSFPFPATPHTVAPARATASLVAKRELIIFVSALSFLMAFPQQFYSIVTLAYSSGGEKSYARVAVNLL